MGANQAPVERTRSQVVESALGLTGGLLWLTLLLGVTAWLTVGSIGTLQFRQDVEQSYRMTVDEAMRRYRAAEAAERQRDLAEAALVELDAERTRREQHMAYLAPKLGSSTERWDDPAERAAKCPPGVILEQPVKQYCHEVAELTGWLATFPAERERRVQALEDARARLVATRTRLAGFMPEPAIGADGSAALAFAAATAPAERPAEDLLGRIQFMAGLGFLPLLVMPADTLRLCLALTMGLLGSLIAMTWAFLSPGLKPPLRWYLLRPVVGALSAVVLFVFVQGGQLVITAQPSQASLDPFMLAMLSVIAGLLADRAYERMAQIGVKVLGLDDSARQRWAVGLRQLPLERAQAVAATSGLSAQRIGEIAAEEAPASPAEQEAIAAALERPPRELFTDIPPARAA